MPAFVNKVRGAAYILKAKKFAKPPFQSKKMRKKCVNPGVIFGPFEVILGHLGSFLGHLGSFWVILGPFWVILGHLGSYLATLGHFWPFLNKL